MRLTLIQAIANARSTGYARLFPTDEDPRVRDSAVFPQLSPRFTLTKGASLFTLGSCFARSLEERFPDFELPTRSLAVPKSERPGRPNGILNEYNPGTMCQRIEYAARGASFGDLCIAPEGDGYVDLLLPEYVTPTTKERLMERRVEVDRVYNSLFACEAVLVTLDVVEAWYDSQAGLYVNRIPPTAFLLANRERFELHILDLAETQQLLERMVKAFEEMGVKKILLAVSPIPLEATYSGRDCAVANVLSKSILVLSASYVSQRYSAVDYFPGYEIVLSAGPASCHPSYVPVRDDVVELATSFLIEQYAR